MKYLKNAEIVSLYNISDKAVRNWIESARLGKLKLDLLHDGNRHYIADTIHNTFVIEELVERGRKYRNSRSHVSLSPTEEFYTLFDQKQIAHIATELEKHREFPQQYRYFGEGAKYWDAYLHKLHATRNNNLRNTIDIINLDIPYINWLINAYTKVNVVDLGVGNGLAAKELLTHLIGCKKLQQYIGIDASPDQLKITESNLRRWFGGEIQIQTHIKDLNFEQFGDLIVGDSNNQYKEANILLFTGGILGNFRNPGQALTTIRESMGKDDLLISSLKLDGDHTRRFFDFNIQSDKTSLSLRNRLPLDYLSIKEEYYEVEQLFDEKENSRFIRVRLKLDISLEIKTANFRRIVEFHKGDTLLLFRSREYNNNQLVNLYDTQGLHQVHTTISPGLDYVVMMSKVKC